MHRTRFWLVGAALLLAVLEAAQAPLNTAAIHRITVIAGTPSGREYKVSVPQNDLDVRGDGFPIVFLHHWGVGPADRLAQGVRAALDATGPARHGSSR